MRLHPVCWSDSVHWSARLRNRSRETCLLLNGREKLWPERNPGEFDSPGLRDLAKDWNRSLHDPADGKCAGHGGNHQESQT